MIKLAKEIKYCKKIFEKSFTGESTKQAYLKACKFYSSKFIARGDEFGEVSCRFIKETSSQLPTITLKVYAMLSETELREKNCTICREAHSSFFLNNSYSCAECHASAYLKRLDTAMEKKELMCKEKRKGWEK